MAVLRLSVPILSPGQGAQDPGKTESQYSLHMQIFLEVYGLFLTVKYTND